MPAVPGVGDAAVAGNWQLQFVKGGVGVAILVSLHDSQAAPADKVGGDGCRGGVRQAVGCPAVAAFG